MFTKTENGAVVFDSTGHTLLDLNFNALGMRKKDPSTIVSIFAKAYEEDPLLAVRWLFYAGDIRQGMGERRLFRTILPYVAKRHPHVLQFVGEYNRFDSLLPLLDDSELGPVVAGLIKNQVIADLDNLKAGKSISLLGKWLPSINASSDKTRKYARILSTALFDSHKTYRKTCATLRKAIDIVETKMCEKQWDSIDYSKVPGVAVHRYRKAFNRNDTIRFADFNVKAVKGEVKKNAGTLSPAEIVYSYLKNFQYDPSFTPDLAVEASWKAMPDLMKDGYSILPVCDVSESMQNVRIDPKSGIRPIDAAIGLSLYCANHNHCAAFKNKIISFSGIPKFIDADGSTVADNINRIMRRGNRGYNTDIVKVFELYLSTLLGAGIPTDAVLPTLVIFSDMEFDKEAPGNMGFRNEDPTLFNSIRRKYNHYGYELPRLVLWNLASRNGGAPMRTNAAGIVMISGLNQATMDMVFCDKTDPFEILCDKLNSERYNQIKLEG